MLLPVHLNGRIYSAKFKNSRSRGLPIPSSQVFLPSYTFPMYRPNGIANATVSANMNITPRISVVI